MEHRRFGRTGLQVPVLAFGGGWVGGVLIHGGDEQANAALDLAWESGMDWLDTAADYGGGVSETVMGRWLAGRPAETRPGISTKFRLDTAAGDFRGQMLRIMDESFARLGVDKVPLIFCHNPVSASGTGDGRLSVDDALAVRDDMETLREQGLCDWLGMTALGDPPALQRVLDSGRFDVAQVYYNMLNPTAWEGQEPWNSTNFDGLLKVCARHDMGVMGIRIFAGGHLASPVRHGREIPVTAAADDAAEERRAELLWQTLTDEDGTRAQAAIRFGLACPAVSTVVVGLGEIAHLREAIAGAAMGPLPAVRLSAVSDAWKDSAFTA